jgi:hypothetical protein
VRTSTLHRRFDAPLARLLLAALALLGAAALACGGGAATGEAPTETAETATPVSLRELAQTYTRYGPGPYDLELEITYVPREFFAALGQEVPAEIVSGDAVLFLVRESVHESDLPDGSAELVLVLPDRTLVRPAAVEPATIGYHHRSFRVTYRADVAAIGRLEVAVLRSDGTAFAPSPFVWNVEAAATTAEPTSRTEASP